MSRIAIIGSGFSGISAAAYLAAEGHEVNVYEKNNSMGGRARQFQTDSGYLFDMGPSWYWMPDVFERFFNDFGHKASDFYDLKLLDPSFEVVFKGNESLEIPENFDALCQLFESIESGSSKKLIQFMEEAAYKYKVGVENLVYKPGLSVAEYMDIDVIKGVFRLQVFSSFSKHVRAYFKNPKLITLMEFPILFLGAMPQETPALYSLMNYAGLVLGTWYPIGGFGKVIQGMQKVAEQNGAKFHLNAPIEKIEIKNNLASSIRINGIDHPCDSIIASADYHHIETKLLPLKYRNYTDQYWENKVFAPSCLIFYIGLIKKLKQINHHTLFFDEPFDQHAIEIYKEPQWPSKPLFYVCCPSVSDAGVAPSGHENLFFLMPIAVGLTDTEEHRETYFQMMVSRLEAKLNENITDSIDYKKSYCINDFVFDYNSFKGNAYGLANTLFQTATFKPKIQNKNLKNMFYAGQLTVPGPGVPPSIISGKVASNQLLKYLSNNLHESLI